MNEDANILFKPQMRQQETTLGSIEVNPLFDAIDSEV